MKYFFVILLILINSCSDKKSKDVAIGLSGKINIVMTPDQWDGPIGRTLDSLLTQEMTVLPRPETIFKIRHVDPENVNSSMKRTRNLIFVFTLNDQSFKAGKIKSMLTAESLRQLSEDTVFMKSVPDVYARGQEVVYLFGPDEETLVRKLKRDGQKVIDNFNFKERARITRGLLNASSTKSLSQMLEKERQLSIKIPFGYRLADNQENFVWLRQINPADDKDIFIARRKYETQEIFKRENLIKFRNEICQKYLFEDPEQSDSYLVTETSIEDKEVETREFNFNGLYAVEMKGLWKTNTNTMGGPFAAFAFVDESKGFFYYIEGFTYSPSKDQREIMRELECILYSFKTK